MLEENIAKPRYSNVQTHTYSGFRSRLCIKSFSDEKFIRIESLNLDTLETKEILKLSCRSALRLASILSEAVAIKLSVDGQVELLNDEE